MTLADDLPTIDGLPLHPLVVHAVVVLLPLCAVGTVLIAVRPAWRRRFGTVLVALTVLAVALVPVAQQTGEQLEHTLPQNPLIARHAELGDTLRPYALVFGVLVLALVLTGRSADRRAGSAATATSRFRSRRALLVPLAILAVLSAAATTARVVQIGHSGSTAVWAGVAGLP